MIYANDCYIDADEYNDVMSAYSDVKRGMGYGDYIDDYPDMDLYFDDMLGSVSSIASAVWGGIKTAAGTVLAGVKKVGSFVWTTGKTVAGAGLTGVKWAGTTLYKGGSSVVGNVSQAGKYVWNTAKNVANWTVGGNSLIGKGVKTVGSGLKATASFIAKAAGNTWNWTKTAASNVWKFVSSPFRKKAGTPASVTAAPASQTGQQAVTRETVPAEKSVVKENTVVTAGQTIFDIFGKKVPEGTPLTAGTNVYITNNSDPAIAPVPNSQSLPISYDPNTNQYYYNPNQQTEPNRPQNPLTNGGWTLPGYTEKPLVPGEETGQPDIMGMIMEYVPYALAGGLLIYLLTSKRTSPLRRRATA